MTGRLFSNEIHFVFGAIISKNNFRFFKGHICFHNPQEKIEMLETNRFAGFTEICEMFNSNLSKHVAALEFISVYETIYPMRRQIVFH